jgi:hypothetical protein
MWPSSGLTPSSLVLVSRYIEICREALCSGERNSRAMGCPVEA